MGTASVLYQIRVYSLTPPWKVSTCLKFAKRPREKSEPSNLWEPQVLERLKNYKVDSVDIVQREDLLIDDIIVA